MATVRLGPDVMSPGGAHTKESQFAGTWIAGLWRLVVGRGSANPNAGMTMFDVTNAARYYLIP